eukprot:CAMPEP_0178431488 /NCGR_PEP_ID=MMETSP0689_2-20121128/31875_1 /TAXON_ID=160604 /ORGANISM="Amphidinium massartii, Strain CS-259" /LENGTH=340 /DNA_ID=CAMNT_0020053405 /DNA_START=174 /DNA_END=1196 /DNA_ORIENTATION=-
MQTNPDFAQLHPVVKDRLGRQRSVFAPGHRIRMNIIPMFLNVFVPWGLWILIAGIAGFSMMYFRPGLAWALIITIIVGWFGSVGFAFWARRAMPDPQWFSYFSLITGLAIVYGLIHGLVIYNFHNEGYFAITDLKHIEGVNPTTDKGQNMMDGGVFTFAQGSQIDPTRSWHFKQSQIYCVAPIIGNASTPETLGYDFWAVGKDCCSISSSDFRCGDAANPASRTAIRVLDSTDLQMYNLAVQQTEALYNIQAPHPIFFQWYVNAQAEIDSWSNAGFNSFLRHCAFFFVVCLFGMTLFSCKYSYLGRGESVYDMDFYSDPAWKAGGYAYGQQTDYRTMRYA